MDITYVQPLGSEGALEGIQELEKRKHHFLIFSTQEMVNAAVLRFGGCFLSMHIRAKLAGITLATLALGAARSAAAESPPAHPSTTNVPNLALIQSRGVSVGPELQAALASLGGTAKKSDKDALVDLNRLGDRKSAAGDAGASGLVLPSAAGAPIHSKSGSGESLQLLHADATGAASSDAGFATRVAPVGDMRPAGASTTASAQHPEAVIRGQINPAAKSCYANDSDSKLRRPGKLVILIKLTPAGEVDSVSAPVNIGVSPAVVNCIMTAARATSFGQGANGTIPASFTFPGPADQAPPATVPAANVSVHAEHDGPNESAAQPTTGEASRR